LPGRGPRLRSIPGAALRMPLATFSHPCGMPGAGSRTILTQPPCPCLSRARRARAKVWPQEVTQVKSFTAGDPCGRKTKRKPQLEIESQSELHLPLERSESSTVDLACAPR